MSENFDKHILKNGMVILGEPMQAVESVAFEFMLPAGAAKLPDGFCGAANVIADWIFRGAGPLNSRQLGDALDSLGLHRSSSIGSCHITLASVLESSNLAEALKLYADIILQPALDDEQFTPARQLAIDDIIALDDDPKQKVMLKLREEFYPYPLGRSTAGTITDLQNLTADAAGKIHSDHFNLSASIFAVAGKYDFDKLVTQIESLFAKSPKKIDSSLKIKNRTGKYIHIHNDSAQVHIGLMTPTAKPADQDYYNARLAISLLSGGMSARLFTEIREKRGLCYAIGAMYHGLKEAAGIMCYAGTVPEKAQQTFDCIMEQFHNLKNGITADEMARAKAGLKSALILQSESTTSRAASIGSDYYNLARIRTLDEIKTKIDDTTVESVLEYLKNNPFRDFSVVTIGPKEIKVP